MSATEERRADSTHRAQVGRMRSKDAPTLPAKLNESD